MARQDITEPSFLYMCVCFTTFATLKGLMSIFTFSGRIHTPMYAYSHIYIYIYRATGWQPGCQEVPPEHIPCWPRLLGFPGHLAAELLLELQKPEGDAQKPRGPEAQRGGQRFKGTLPWPWRSKCQLDIFQFVHVRNSFKGPASKTWTY